MTTNNEADVIIDGADLAAELDDDIDPTLPDDDIDDAELFEGLVRGGPWDGRQAQSRYPAGFLLADMPRHQVWIYDRGVDGIFTARSDTPMALDDTKRWAAANDGEYDILTLGAEMGPS